MTTHGLDFERQWMLQNRTNKWVLRRLSEGQTVNNGEYRISTAYNALKRFKKNGLVISDMNWRIFKRKVKISTKGLSEV